MSQINQTTDIHIRLGGLLEADTLLSAKQTVLRIHTGRQLDGDDGTLRVVVEMQTVDDLEAGAEPVLLSFYLGLVRAGLGVAFVGARGRLLGTLVRAGLCEVLPVYEDFEELLMGQTLNLHGESSS